MVLERWNALDGSHEVFESSFDAKAIFSDKVMEQKLNYMHYNRVSGK